VSENLDRLKAALASRYTIEREVGAGGMATVFLAQDLRHERRVAVKVLRPELAATLGPDRFLREIKIAAQLQHPHILPLLDSGEADGFLYYVMPFIEGESLRDRLTRKGELPVPEAVRLLRDVADALSYAHGRGVVHRDIKPDNIMIAGRHALVMDFGVAKAVSEATGRQSLTTVGVALGTPTYMAPEQAAADPHVDHRADIYALGVMGYELLTGQPPFTGLTPQQVLAAHVTEAAKPVSERRAACPPALAEVIMRCLAKRAADRWQSAEELVERLEAVGTPSGGVTPTQTQPTTAFMAPDPWYGHPVRVGGLFLLSAVAVLGVVYFLTIQLGLPDWVVRAAAVLLLLGLPIMLVTGVIERRRATARATGVWSASGESAVRGWFTWRRAIRGGMVAFAGLAGLALVYTAMRLLGIGPVGTLVASGRLAARDKLIIADFTNRAPDSTLGRSVTEAFRIDLSQSPVVNVLGSSTVSDALTRMNRKADQALDATTAREVAMREGAKAVVVGDISPIGKGLVLSARVLSAVDGAELVAVRETADDESGLLPTIDRLSKRMRERIGESLRTIRANEPLEAVTTSSLEALRLYTEGARASDRGESDRAVTLLRQAIALDSGFAMAWRKLAVAVSNARGSQAEYVAAATKAYQHRDRLPEIERYQTTAYYYYTVDYNPEQVISAYRAILELKPDDPIAPNNLALILNVRRRWAEAEQIARAGAERGQGANVWQKVVQAQMAEGKATEARQTIAKMVAEDSGSVLTQRTVVSFFASMGQYDSARAELATLNRMARDPSDQAGTLGLSTALDLTQGELAEAERQIRDLMTLGERRGLPQDHVAGAANLASIQARYRGKPADALRIIEAALARFPLARMAAEDRPYTELAIAYASAGQPEMARRMMTEYRSATPDGLQRGEAFRHAAAGYVALAEKRPAEAIAEFRQWYDETGCTNCGLPEIGRAWDQAGQADSALASYQQSVTAPVGLLQLFGDAWNLAHSYKRLGELYEEKGQREKALEYYGKFVGLWKDADAELQPQVRDVKERMTRLAGEK
jgi:eukaryotic-like serine/threonine-protein kinase